MLRPPFDPGASPDSQPPAGGGGPAAGPEPGEAARYVPFTDPTENAFRMEVPAGWHVQGGIDRSTGEGLLRVLLASPDGQIQVRVPDAPPRLFYVPSMTLASAGYFEGMHMGHVGIQRYQRGVEYARLHAERQVAPALGVQGFRLLGQRDRPDLAQPMQQGAPGVQVSVGEAGFGGHLGGRPVEVRVQATCTLHADGMGGGSWTVFTGAYFAPPERIAEAEAVVEHVRRSWQLNPQWQQREQQRQQQQQTLQSTLAASRAAAQGAAQRAAIWRESSDAVSNIITGGYQAQQASYDQTFQNHGNAFQGTADVTDPASGQTYNVWDQAQNYWIDHGGTIAGTDGPDNPDPTRFRPMDQRE
jgi:hypothetical protein